MKLISIIIPVYNEELNIPLLYGRLREVFGDMRDRYKYEIIFVNDASTDKSDQMAKLLAESDSGVKYLEFSRNFGKETATSAGLAYATGDAAIMMDADLQHPPELIPEFLHKWELGTEVVVGVRNKNNGEGYIKKYGSRMFYALLKAISETAITPSATDFRLLDRKVINEFNRFTERGRLTRGLIDWLGFKRDYVPFEAAKRKHGVAGYSTVKLIKLALSSFVSHSLLPLRLAGYMGLAIMLTSGPLGVFIFFEKYIFHDPLQLNFSGPAMLGVLILFLVGIILSALGLIALYIASIHTEVTNRPLYVLRDSQNLEYRGPLRSFPSFGRSDEALREVGSRRGTPHSGVGWLESEISKPPTPPSRSNRDISPQ